MLFLAGDEGFEPSQTESESVVLPLHKSPIFSCSLSATVIIIAKSLSIVKYIFTNFRSFIQLFSKIILLLPFVALNAILSCGSEVVILKYAKQFTIIMLISLIGECLNNLIPLPIPASIYGVVILFLCLETKIIPLDAVRETGKFLVSLMQIMFIPATVGLIDTWDVFAPNLIAYTVIIIVSTFAVMLVSGKVTQIVISLSKKGGKKDA